ncbi:MAG: UvrD-helicase domain-containing protein [Mobilitalea sp.]
MEFTPQQAKAAYTRNKNLLVSAAAGSGKTAVLVERIIAMISEGEHPIDIDHLLVVTFTNAAAAQMRDKIGVALEKKLKEAMEVGDKEQKISENTAENYSPTSKGSTSNAQIQHLQKQLSLLQSSQITTIHSFCLNVIRNYFHRIDLDPGFKIAEESEITLMKSDVISDVLERWYEEGREDFHDFIESYSYSKSDEPIEELILQLYTFSMSNPWPKEWIAEKQKMFDITTMEQMNTASWMKELLDYVKVVLGDLLKKNAAAIEICEETDGPTAYSAALLSDLNTLTTLRGASSYAEYADRFAGITYDRLSSKKEEGVAVWKKDKVKGLRDEVKKGIKDLANQFFFQSQEEMLLDLQAVNGVMQVLFELTLEFMEEFAKKKEEKNLIDFNDLEHFALRILIEEKSAEIKVPSMAALELSEEFEEILIDEYQDSNMVQETILRSISREDTGHPNRFMVGDVKQSIYKFRLAMPEIFMEKYASYSLEELTKEGETNLYQRIDLDKNFRSRKQVLNYVNVIFEQIMQQSIGGIVYDDAASLKYGELFEETLLGMAVKGENNDAKIMDNKDWDQSVTSRLAGSVELLLVTEEENNQTSDMQNQSRSWEADPQSENIENTSVDDTDEDLDETIYTKKEMEAKAIARKIKELTNPDTGMLIFDGKTKEHRLATYRDIVILLRSMSNWSEVFVNTLMQEGILAYADTGTGYFSTIEIMTVLNMLRIIDNPRQDIPLTGVLYSPIVGLTTTELAYIRAANRNSGMYSAILAFLAEEVEGAERAEGGLRGKLRKFMNQLDHYRSMVNHKPIHELIQLVLDETGYYYYATAMQGGERRKANIDMLIAKAVQFEKGSYTGLFHFIRYIEKLHKYEVDFGEAATFGEQDNTVRIMSIHKSKGLEFPVVFVGGMSKQFNTQDLKRSIVLHSELGAGPEYIDSKLRTKIPTLIKKVIQKKVQIENLGEELRVLYVAMTRAKEKLILTGYLKTKEDIKKKDFSFFELLSAKSYLDWVLPAMVNRMGSIPEMEENIIAWENNEMSIVVLPKSELLKEEMQKQTDRQIDKEILLHMDMDRTYDIELKEEVKSRINFVYPYQTEAGIKGKMTVSELKKLGQFMDEEMSVNLYAEDMQTGGQEQVNMQMIELHREDVKIAEREQSDLQMVELKQPEKTDNKKEQDQFSKRIKAYSDIMKQIPLDEEIPATIPAFLRENDAVMTGTDRGTLYHKVLELLDLTKVHSREDLSQELGNLVVSGRIVKSDVDKLKLDYIFTFSSSNIASRMKEAQKSGKLYKEKQFVIGLPAKEVIRNSNSEELILIQGIIDAFFEEDGELVLLDYKSDIIDNEEILIKRYQVQLEYYKKALEQMLHKKVKEMIIYSLPLGKEIVIRE